MANFTTIPDKVFTFFGGMDVENTTTAEMEVVDVAPPQSSRPPNYQGLVLGTSLVILIILMNLVSLIAFAVEKRLRTYNNYFIINLAIADFTLGINQTVGIAHTFLSYFPFNQDVCKVYVGIRNALFSVSVVGVVVICIDRHRATYDPINHFISRSKARAMKLNALTWLIAFGFWMPYSTGWDFAVGVDSGRSCVAAHSRSAIGQIVQNVVSFFFPLTLITILYLRIFLKIKKSLGGKNVSSQFDDAANGRSSKLDNEISSSLSTNVTTISCDVRSGEGLEMTDAAPQVNAKIDKADAKDHTTNRESSHESKKATRTLSYIVLSFVIAWLPNSLIYLIFAINPQLIAHDRLHRDLRQFFVWLRYANSLLNPICYAASQPLFRKTVSNMFCRPRKYC